MKAILLSIGDELALGQTVDTNSAWLAERLTLLGVSTLLHETIADDRALIAASLRWATQRADLIVVTGGLGPTDDDLTRQALAEAMGVSLVEDAEAMRALEAYFRGRGPGRGAGYVMAERNRVQAMCPAGATMIANTCGTAPGLRATLNRAEVFVTPGVPREMKTMYGLSVEPALRVMLEAEARREGRAGSRVILTTKINTFGLGESDVAERLGDLMRRDRNPTVGTTVSDGFCGVRLRAEADDEPTARAALADTLAQAETRLGGIVFGRDDDTLQGSLLDLLKARRATVATAESCTGGLIGAMLTDVPGSSAAYLGGWVTYTNAMKSSEVGVPPQLIARHGAVSEQVVLAMAEGARRRSGADFALAVSGVAGPDGGTADKPVGTVWIALASAEGTEARVAHLIGDRAAVRDRAAKCALQWLRLTLLGQDSSAIRWMRRPGNGISERV